MSGQQHRRAPVAERDPAPEASRPAPEADPSGRPSDPGPPRPGALDAAAAASPGDGAPADPWWAQPDDTSIRAMYRPAVDRRGRPVGVARVEGAAMRRDAPVWDP